MGPNLRFDALEGLKIGQIPQILSLFGPVVLDSGCSAAISRAIRRGAFLAPLVFAWVLQDSPQKGNNPARAEIINP
jgi:hypothetical protein